MQNFIVSRADKNIYGRQHLLQIQAYILQWRRPIFFAEEFVIWKQWVRKTLNLSVIQTVNFSCPLFVCSAG